MSRIRKFGAVLAAALCGFLPGGQAEAWQPVIIPQAFTGCTIYTDADLPPIKDGTLVTDGVDVIDVGPSAEVKVPEGIEIVPCDGATILPGFWNAHVHLNDPRSPEELSQGNTDAFLAMPVEDMFFRYGFTRLVDTGSDPDFAIPVRDWINGTNGFLIPVIRAAGVPLVPPKGTPFYATDFKFIELANARQARGVVSALLDAGVDIIKLMTVSLTRDNPLPAMSPEVVKAVVETAHARDSLVLAHPTNREGVELAIEGGVDVLLHTAPIGGPWDEALVKRMVAANISLVPTLALWDYEAAKTNDEAMAKHFREVSAQQVQAFVKAGGRILFGTDAGYMTEYDPTNEYLALQAAGLSFKQILASLIKNPAQVLGAKVNGHALESGTLEKGWPATFVMVDADPAEDIRRLAQVRYTYIRGNRVYARRP